MIKSLEIASLKLRERAIDLKNNKILIANFYGTLQENDLKQKPCCNGYARIKHFNININNWVTDPLPILPASESLDLSIDQCKDAIVFQNAICNYDCWYCFVDHKLRAGKKSHSSMLSCSELLDLLFQELEIPKVIDLSGGQPDLMPEWTLWMMKELELRGVSDNFFLWSDDNLSTDFFWKFLNEKQINYVENYKNYAKVCCFKGFSPDTFQVNTGVDGRYFLYQIENFRKLLASDINLYSYITLTSPSNTNFELEIPRFLDLIQKYSENYILRIVPLKIIFYGPSKRNSDLILGQDKALNVWEKELTKRFSSEALSQKITQIQYK